MQKHLITTVSLVVSAVPSFTGKSYEHRRQWVVDRIMQLTSLPSTATPTVFRLKDYLEIVDWTGLAILENNRGYIPGHQSPVLERLLIDPKHWLYMTQHFESRFKGLVGASHSLKAACRKLMFRRTPNLGAVLRKTGSESNNL